MPRIDIAQAKREALAATDPIVLVLGGKEYTFPAAMPAEVELTQMDVQEEIAKLGLDDASEAPVELHMRLVEAAYGSEVLAELRAERVPESDIMIGFGTLLAFWVAAYQDPSLPHRLMALARTGGAGTTSARSSASGGPSSKRTSSVSTASTSAGPSSPNGSPGGASPRSTTGSAPRR